MTLRMPMDPALRAYLDALAAAQGPPVAMSDGERVVALRKVMPAALASRDAIPGLPNGVVMREVTLAAGLTGRLYRSAPESHGEALLVYLHGGGWVVGSTATHDPFCRLLCQASGCAILSVEYRLAPEHPYPAALEDTLAAVAWARAHAASLRLAEGRLALGGDSAGANLAAVAVNRLCAAGRPAWLAAQLLLYPVTEHPEPGLASYTENATGCGLEAAGMRWFWRQYAPHADAHDGSVYPLRAALPAGLPPALVATAEYDVLRDDGLAYAARLRTAGVDVLSLHAPDMHHNFPVHPGTVARFPQALAALADIARWLGDTLGR